MPSVQIFHEDGSTESIPTTTGWRVKEKIGEMYRLTIMVERSLAQGVSLTRKRDEVELEGYPRGVLTDVDSGTETWTLTVTSPEWYANLTEPTLGGTAVEGTDSELITDRINAVDEWSAGSIAELTGPMNYVFNHAFQHDALRTIEANVPGEIQFAGDGTVDYVDQLGTNRSGTLELSPSQGNLEQRIQITERGTRLDATHLRVIGAHEGEAQFTANLVPDDDGATYENRVNYTTDRWEPGDPRDWDTWANKDVMSQDTIEEEAAALGPELTEEYVEAETTVSGDVLNLGDFVQVVKPDADLDRRMRVHRLVTKSVDDAPAGVVQEVVLSTRTIARDDINQDRRDIKRFNKSFQGSSVAINVGPFRSAVDSRQPIEIPFRYPDLEFENTATLQVRGLSYRIDSRPVPHDHDVTVTHPSHDHSVDIFSTSDENTAYGRVSQREEDLSTADLSSGWQTLDTWSITTTTSEIYLNTMMYDFIGLNDGEIAEINVRVENTDTGEYYPNQSGSGIQVTRSSEIDNFGTGNVTIGVPGDLNFDDLEAQVELDWQSGSGTLDPVIKFDWVAYGTHQHVFDDVETSDTALGTTETTTSDTTTGVEPGIFTTADTPSGVDVAVNGSTVATDIGTGTFEMTVDVSGEFTTDAWNSIELSSDTLGLLQATLFIEGYDQVGKR